MSYWICFYFFDDCCQQEQVQAMEDKKTLVPEKKRPKDTKL